MRRRTVNMRLPEDLIEAVDRRATARGVTRSQLVTEAVQRMLEDRLAWSPGFLRAIETPRRELQRAAEEMMASIRSRRSRSGEPEL